MVSGARVTPGREIKRQCRRRAHSCWDHLIVARERTIVVLGHEHNGIPDEAMELVDVAVEIPMIGTSTAARIAAMSTGPLARIPRAPPATAARAIRVMGSGPYSGLVRSAWQEMTIARGAKGKSITTASLPHPVRRR